MRATFGLSVLVSLAVAGSAAADVAPPDPKPGMKRVQQAITVEVAGELPGYVLYRVWWDYGPDGPPRRGPAPRPDRKPPTPRADRVTFTPGVAWTPDYAIYTVPEAAPAGFPNDTTLADALQNNKVPGAHRVPFTYSGDEIPIDDPRTVRTTRHVIERIDPAQGVICTVMVDDPKPVERGSWPLWVGGIACATAVVLAGLWLARRSRG